MTEMLTLTLGDFLDRIPENLLDSGPHDRSIPLPFDLAALSERIGRGETQIPISEIYRRIPDIFRTDTVIRPELAVRFPWRKVLPLITQARDSSAASGFTKAGLETLVLKLKARKFRRPAMTAPAPLPASRTSPLRPAIEAAPPTNARSAEPPGANTPLLTPPPALSGAVAGFISVAEPLVATAASGDFSSPEAMRTVQGKAEFERQLTALAEERDKARAEVESLRTKLTEYSRQSASERRAAEEISNSFALFKKEHGEILAAGGALKAERDAALARATEFGAEHDAAIARIGDIVAERDAAVARTAELTTERDAAVTRTAKLTPDSDAAVALAAEVTIERDAAIARTVELTTERDVAVARTAELTAERDAAVALAAKLTADSDAAVTLAAKVATERDAALARTTELTTEREAEVALTAKLTAERDAADALTAKLTADSDAAVALAAEVTTERDAALARTAELTTERDAAVARAADLLKIGNTTPASTPTPDQVAWESRTVAKFAADIEGYRNTIQALLRERDALRLEQNKQTAQCEIPTSAAPVLAEEKATLPVSATDSLPVSATDSLPLSAVDSLPDAYSALFPPRLWLQRAAAALLLGFIGIGIASRFGGGYTLEGRTETPVVPSMPSPELPFTLPTLTPAALPESEFTLETPATEETMTLLESEPLIVGLGPERIDWKPITSRRGH